MKKNLIIKCIISILMAALLLTGCSFSGSGKKPSPLNLLENAEPEQLKTNLVKITGEREGTLVEGTGFFVPSGYLVTSSNLVDISDEVINVTYPDGTTKEAYLGANNVNTDIALLTTNKPSVAALSFSETPIVAGESYYVAGYTKDGDTVQIQEIQISEQEAENAAQAQIAVINQIDSAYLPGSIIVDKQAQMVGVVGMSLKDKKTSFMLQISPLSESIATLENEPETEQQRSSSTRRNIYTESAKTLYGIDATGYYSSAVEISGSVTAPGSGCVLSIDQQNSNLIELHYSMPGTEGDNYGPNLFFGIQGTPNISIATVTTDQGEYQTEMNRIMVLSGKQGIIYLHYPEMEGIINKLTITEVLDKGYDQAIKLEIPIEVKEVSKEAAENEIEQEGTWRISRVTDYAAGDILMYDVSFNYDEEANFISGTGTLAQTMIQPTYYTASNNVTGYQDFEVNNDSYPYYCDTHSEAMPELFYPGQAPATRETNDKGQVTYEEYDDGTFLSTYNYKYDSSGNMVYRDSYHQYKTNSDIYSKTEDNFYYDPSGDVLEKTSHFYDNHAAATEGTPVTTTENYIFDYDEDGNIIKVSIYGPDSSTLIGWTEYSWIFIPKQ